MLDTIQYGGLMEIPYFCYVRYHSFYQASLKLGTDVYKGLANRLNKLGYVTQCYKKVFFGLQIL